MRYSSAAIFVILAFLAPQRARLQGVNIGTPPILNFSKQEYKAGTQNWDITQDRNGVMWYANNNGVLEFDGTHWRLYPLDNGTIARSVQAGADGRIYVGAQGDFGYLAPDPQGVMHYHSLKLLLPENERGFSDVWDIEVRDDGVFFRSDNQVFRWHAEKLSTLFPPGKAVSFMGEWGQKLLVQDAGHHLYVFENDGLQPLESPASFETGQISAIIALPGDTTLLTTIRDGIFYSTGGDFQPWPTADDAFLKINRIFCAGLLPDGKIAIGTSLNGLVTLDAGRRIFHHINRSYGLRNNTVLSLFAAKNGNIWVGLDNGVGFINLFSPFSTFFPDGELQGTGYAAQVFNQRLYFGTNSGLFTIPWRNYYSPSERRQFSAVANSEGQVWSLNTMDERLFMGHHEGAFEVLGLSARKITPQQGIWRFLQLSPDLAIAGHYNGLSTFRKKGGQWAFDKALSGFSESSRILAQDESGNIWMAHPYRGIYRLSIDAEKGVVSPEFFGAAQGLPSDLGNALFKIGDQIIFTGASGIYDFDEQQKRFVPNVKFGQIFGEKTQVKYLNQDAEGNIWYVTAYETGVLYIENNTLEKKVRRVPIPELRDKLTDGFLFLLPVDKHNVFIATGQGFIHFDPAAYKADESPLNLVIHEVRLKSQLDSLLFGGQQSTGKRAVLTSGQNSFLFSFSVPDYPKSEFIRYAHFLEGIETSWSEWNTQTDVILNHLRPGDYVFHVKAKNQYGVESKVLSYAFTILPHWYTSRWAYFFYFMLILGLIGGAIYRQQKKFEAEKQNLQSLHRHREEEHQLHARRSEEAISQLQHEKLLAEVTHKTQELASAAMHLVQKNTILSNIQGALSKLQSKITSPELEKEVTRIIKMMEHDTRVDDDWQHFSQNFDQVHSDFLKRLSEKHTHLSPNDYRLCAYLRMNLSSKEIASLMNISLRGVEASRYRLRRRLGLDTEVNLTEYLIRF